MFVGEDKSLSKSKILIIEDDQGLWPLYSSALSDYHLEIDYAATANQANSKLLHASFDLALVDYQLPDGTGICIVERFHEKVACVLVTAMGDEKLVVEAMHKGAKDYVVKDASGAFFKLLPGVIAKSIAQSKLQRELNDTRERIRTVFDSASDLMIVTSKDLSILELSKNAALMYAAHFLQRGYALNHWVDKSKLMALLLGELEDVSLELTIGARQIPFKICCRPLIKNEYLFIFQNISDALEIKRAEKVIATISKEKTDLMVQNRVLASRSNIETSSIIGFTKSMLALKKTITNVADTNANILVVGETGTGKELVANEIHCQSQRNLNPLIKLNCASIPENLVESELFGHVKGAFTGAIRDHKGKFQQADSGTLFLDEIGELSLSVQAKLLRVLQEGSFEAVGGNKNINVDVRIIAATNRNLASMVKQGKFRADLFYRLNVIPITVPPLRSRSDDIVLLANHFIDRYCSLYMREKPVLLDEHLNFLREHNWPGNIRELQNTMERFVVLGQLDSEQYSEFEKNATDSATEEGSSQLRTLESVERQHLLQVLSHCRWRISGDNGAAKILGLNPSTLRFRMKKLGINKSGTST